MTLDTSKLLDSTGRQILLELETDGRLSFTELGRRVGLSLPAVAERVRKLEVAGIIVGYRAAVNQESVGLPIGAYIRIKLEREYASEAMRALMDDMPEVLECLNLTGDDCAIVRVAVSSIPHLERIIQQLKPLGQTTTSIILSSMSAKSVSAAAYGILAGEEAPRTRDVDLKPISS